MKSNHYSKPKSQKDKVWRYIRRNKHFSFSDVMIVCGVTVNYLKTILWHLEGAKYVEIKGKNKPLTQRFYIHCIGAKFGIKSPSIVNGVVYDLNTSKEYNLKPVKENKPFKEPYKPDNLISLLKAMTLETMTKQDIAKIANVEWVAAKKYWKRIEDVKILRGAKNGQKKTKADPLYLRKNGKKLFIIDRLKVSEALVYLQSGQYNRKVNCTLEDAWKQ